MLYTIKTPVFFFINRYNTNLQITKLSYFQILKCDFHYTAGFDKEMKTANLLCLFCWILMLIPFFLCIYYGDPKTYHYLFLFITYPVLAVVHHFRTKYVFFRIFIDSKVYLYNYVSTFIQLITTISENCSYNKSKTNLEKLSYKYFFFKFCKDK